MFTSRSRSRRYSGSDRSISAWSFQTPAVAFFGVAESVIAAESNDRYTRPAVRLIEIRLLEGPNVYRLEPAVKVEVAVGRRRTWYGPRAPGRHALVRLASRVPRREWPDDVAGIVAWARRLRREHDEGVGGVTVHRSS